MLRVGTVWGGTADIQRAGRHTSDPAAAAATERVTGGLEGLALVVSDAVQLTAQLFLT